MKHPLQKRPAFILKSMLWSLLLYTLVMLAFNWDEVSSKISGSYAAHIANTTTATQTPRTDTGNVTHAKIAAVGGIIGTVYELVHIVAGYGLR